MTRLSFVVMAAWVYLAGQSVFPIPGLKPGHLRARNAIGVALVSSMMGRRRTGVVGGRRRSGLLR